MNANELTFGVEIECCVPVSLAIRIGGYHAGVQVSQLADGWKAEADSSITPPVGFRAVEIVSPILKGADGLKHVMTTLAWLRSVGAIVNRSTGFHVHVGFDAARTTDLARVVALVARHEKALFAVTGTRSRERGNYCQSIRESYVHKEFKAKPGPRIPADRYFSLNLRNLAYCVRPTVEFRVFAGTLSDLKAIGYIRLCLGIVEKAMKTSRTVAWDLTKTSREQARYAETGEGKYAAIKLVYGLGWRRGEVATSFGLIEEEGLPQTDEIIQELYRLAEKYDSRG